MISESIPQILQHGSELSSNSSVENLSSVILCHV